MRPEDFSDYFRLRKLVENPLEVVKFRKGQQTGETLRVRFKAGCSLYLRGGCHDFHMFHRIFLRDEYRLSSVEPKAWACVVDLGANAGIFSSRASELAKRVVACEPVPSHFEHLSKNVAGREEVTRVNKAIAGEAGTLKIYRSKHASLTGTNSAFGGQSELLSDEYDEAEAITLDELFAEHGVEVCDLLKIDIEGAEYGILHGASVETFAKIQRIHGEYHDVDKDDPRTRIANFTEFLRSKGFSVTVVPHLRKQNHGMFFAQR